MKNPNGNLLLLIGVLALSGCATSRGVLDVEQQVDENPATGQAVTFVRVSDNREFEIAPPVPSTPSLKGGEIGNPAITSRAIARKRGGFGQALGDILLPEGDTVAGLVQAALTDAFRDRGYRVVTESDPDFGDAIPLEVDIERFWGWFQPGFWQVKIHYESLIHVKGDVGPYADGKTYEKQTEISTSMATGEVWLRAVSTNLDELSIDVFNDLPQSDQ